MRLALYGLWVGDGLGSPAGLALDVENFLYIADYAEDVIYKVDEEGEAGIFATSG